MWFRKNANCLFILANVITFMIGLTIFLAGRLFAAADIMIMIDEFVYRFLQSMGDFLGVRYDEVIQNTSWGMIASGGYMITTVPAAACLILFYPKVCCIHTFMAFLVPVILFQVIGIVGLIFIIVRTDSWLRGELTALLKLYQGPMEKDFYSDTLNRFFTQAHCCGVDSFTDFRSLGSVWYNNTGGTKYLPESCCKAATDIYEIEKLIGNSSDCPTTPKDYYTQGCHAVISKQVLTYMGIIVFLSAVGIVFESLSIVTSIKLKNTIGSKARRTIQTHASPSQSRDSPNQDIVQNATPASPSQSHDSPNQDIVRQVRESALISSRGRSIRAVIDLLKATKVSPPQSCDSTRPDISSNPTRGSRSQSPDPPPPYGCLNSKRASSSSSRSRDPPPPYVDRHETRASSLSRDPPPTNVDLNASRASSSSRPCDPPPPYVSLNATRASSSRLRDPPPPYISLRATRVTSSKSLDLPPTYDSLNTESSAQPAESPPGYIDLEDQEDDKGQS